jgi:hypothetical protein
VYSGHIGNGLFLSGEDLAQVDFLSPEADPSALSDRDGSIVERVLELGEPSVRSRRGFVELSGVFHVQRLVWPFMVVAFEEVVELRLLLAV